MTVRILEASMIVDFSGDGFISAKIESDVAKKVSLIQSDKLKDWEICFRFWYNNVKQILVYTKNKSYPEEKYKEITIHIPMPGKDKARWGIEISQHVYENDNHLEKIIKNFHCLDVDYSKFINRQDYILDCMKRAINFCFEEGFTINGVKIKVDNFASEN